MNDEQEILCPNDARPLERRGRAWSCGGCGITYLRPPPEPADRFVRARLHVQRAETLVAAGRVSDGVAHLRVAAHALEPVEQREQLALVLERMAALAPDDFAIRMRACEFHRRAGDARRALAHLQHCHRLQPRDVHVLERVAECFCDLGAVEKAVVVLREASARWCELGGLAAARQMLERALQLRPEDAETVAALAALGAATER